MGLRIQTNVAAMNAHRNLTIADAGLSKSLQRLSSGYRINTAADDASGLAIATKFRADIASLGAASRNVTEASSLLQVAQGGTDTISGIITRMKELATQAASGSAERARIDEEQSALEAEVTRIVNSTKYNGSKMLDGSFGTISVSDYGSLTEVNGITALNVAGATGGSTYTIAHQSTDNTMTITLNGTAQTLTAVAQGTLSTGVLDFSSHGLKVSYNDVYFDISGAGLAADTIATTHTATATFQVSYENDATASQIGVDLDDLSLATLNLDLDLSTITGAQNALDSIDAAVTTLTAAQGKIGASANRLSYASANIVIQLENFSASESIIRDVDMAAEMTMFTKNQILLQAGTAMLAQANLAPQQVLALFG